MDESKRVTFNLDGVFGFLNSSFELFLALFKPILHFIKTVSEDSWLGLALIFLIFFTLFLIRMGARTGKGFATYARSLEYVGMRGLLAAGAFLALLAAEWLFMPPLSIFLGALANSLSGGEPGLGQLIGFLGDPTPQRAAFMADIRAVYRSGETALPLGWRPATLVAVAFASMLFVGRAGGRLGGAP